jgi:RNA polymerase sigma-70 factor (ECF subfamily)
MGFLYARYADNVYGYVRSIVHDPHDAEDITQHVFAKLMHVIGKYEEREVPFLAWVLRVSRNVALDYVRRPRPIPVEDVRTSDEGGSDPAGATRLNDLREALSTLPREQREVLVLRHLAGLSPTEIAERTGRSEGSVHGLHHRGRRALTADARGGARHGRGVQRLARARERPLGAGRGRRAPVHQAGDAPAVDVCQVVEERELEQLAQLDPEPGALGVERLPGELAQRHLDASRATVLGTIDVAHDSIRSNEGTLSFNARSIAKFTTRGVEKRTKDATSRRGCQGRTEDVVDGARSAGVKSRSWPKVRRILERSTS